MGGARAKFPECTLQRVWKDGIRYTRNGDVQRYICRECGYRFSETSLNQSDSHEPVERIHTNKSNNTYALTLDRQVCVAQLKGMKNLVTVQPQQEKAGAGATTKPDLLTIKSKIIEFAWWMKKNGYAEATIELYTNTVRVLAERGAKVFDPESVKEVIAEQKWSEARKHNAIAAYTLFLAMQGQKWEPPICHVARKLPFIPIELEIDQLIAGCGKKTATFLQLLKETAMRSGEANSIEWTDIDAVNRTITLNNPEKNSNPRIFKVSSKLIDMLNALPKTSGRIFGDRSTLGKRATLYKSRKLIAKKLQNPRILKIHFHTLRHWKATMLYHQTKDVIYVKNFLGHKRIENTLFYIQLAETIFKDVSSQFISRAAKTVKRARSLIEAGFEYVTNMDGVKIFRKPK